MDRDGRRGAGCAALLVFQVETALSFQLSALSQVASLGLTAEHPLLIADRSFAILPGSGERYLPSILFWNCPLAPTNQKILRLFLPCVFYYGTARKAGKELRMNASASPSPRSSSLPLSMDVWAVIVAFLLAVLVRAGILKHVPW